MKCVLLALLFTNVTASATISSYATEDTSSNAANPIRKVVNMLQMMIKKIEAEKEKETELYDKFMCYCKTADETLAKSIADANTKMPQLASDIKEAEAEKVQLEQDLQAHQTDRDSAKAAMAKATEIREKEAAAFAKEESNDKANIDAIRKAMTAIEKGMSGGFLQTSAASILKQLVISNVDLVDYDREELVAFLQGSSDYAPKSGEIVGILKQLADEMDKDYAALVAQEEAAKKSYEELMAAKTKEVEALSKAIEEKLVRVGELGVEIVQMKNDLTDTEEALVEDTQFLADLGKNCASKKTEWEERCKTVSEELLALSETIKILNDDDALELFKKTLPSASFVQIEVTTNAMRRHAMKLLKGAGRNSHLGKPSKLDFILLALDGKKVGFEKVIKLIDNMVVTLKKEQQDDDHKKEYCTVQLDIADDSKKELERAISDSEKAIAESQDTLNTVNEEIKTLQDGIVALDKSVAEATEQRKDENADYTELMAGNSAAKELILFAKNRMQKFYNPKLYKAPPKRELTEEERVTLNMGGTLAPTNPPGGIAGTGVSFVQIHAHNDASDAKKDAPPPAPEAKFGGTKSEESGGVLAMMDGLVRELDKEITEAEATEKNGQEDYEQLMKDSAGRRAEDSKAITEKEAAKADLETELQAHGDKKAADEEELTATKQYISTLHTDCDFLLQYYTVRKDARASEIDALGKAKAVLNGADFS